MSQINADVERTNMETEKREIKLTAKALENKLERLQHERKGAVNKIKALIPQIKAQMKSKENATEIPSQLDKVNALCKKAKDLHNELLPLLPDEEEEKQTEWFSSIMDYSDVFKHKVETWIQENLHENSNKSQFETHISEQPQNKNDHAEQAPVEKGNDLPDGDPLERVPTVQDPQDALHACDSVSNTSKSSRSHHTGSSASRSSARLKSESNLAFLAAKQKTLMEKHALEEEELRLRKRKEQFAWEEEELKLRKKKEQFLLNNEIAEEKAKLSFLKSQSSVGGKTKSKVSDGMNSYYTKTHSKRLDVNATEFVPSQPVRPKHNAAETMHPTVKPKVIPLPDMKQPPGPPYMLQRYLTAPEDTVVNVTQQGNLFDKTDGLHNDKVLDIMRKQNEITTLLMQQQSLSALPKREMPIFDGNPLKYHSFY